MKDISLYTLQQHCRDHKDSCENCFYREQCEGIFNARPDSWAVEKSTNMDYVIFPKIIENNNDNTIIILYLNKEGNIAAKTFTEKDKADKFFKQQQLKNSFNEFNKLIQQQQDNERLKHLWNTIKEAMINND